MSEEPTPRPRRSLGDISKLFDSLDGGAKPATKETPTVPLTPKTPAPELVVTPTATATEGLLIPPALEMYLPPDLWRKLTSDTPRTGVLVNVFERLNSLLYTISTYIPGDLVQEKMNRPVPGLVSGKILRGTLLFSDVSGFTALSERLATLGPQGAELLTNAINKYFSNMIDIVSWSNGTLLKFAGDATLIYFPEQNNREHIEWACRAGLRMLRAMSNFSNIATPMGPVSLAMKVGMSTGDFLAASIGSPKRTEYALIGNAITQVMQAEGASSAGQLVANQAAADFLSDGYETSEAAKPGFAVIQSKAESKLDDFEIRPEKRRGRRALPWDATPQDIMKEIETVLLQIQSLTPYLASELVDRIIVHAHQRQVQSEFRYTVVMFCNFTGPENLLKLWGESGTQRVTGLLSAYFNDMNDAITRYGGIVSRIDPYSQGTKLLALFGAPISHEDDPQRAINAALAMNSALQALNRRWAEKLARHLPEGQDTLIEHRIGITIGETYAGQAGASTRREYTVMGDDVNLAARLMSAAVPGQILVTLRVYERVDTHFVGRSLPAIRVKGKKKPIPIFQIDGPRENTLFTRLENRAPLIGRLPEMEQGWRSFQSGQPALLNITGPAGIGKSHLADSLLQQAQAQGWLVHSHQCRSYQVNEPYGAWIGLLRSIAGITSLDHPLIQREKLDRLVATLGIAAPQASALTDLLGLRQAQETAPETSAGNDLFDQLKQGKANRRASSLDVFSQLDSIGARNSSTSTTQTLNREVIQRQMALLGVISALSPDGKLVLFFEDAHWMDTQSRESLSQIYKSLPKKAIVFMLAYRPHSAELKIGETLVMDTFTRQETGEMVASILTAGLIDIIQEQSSGSPLFVQEISRWIQRTYNISANDLRRALQTSDVLRKLVLSQVESLPENQREVARLASVIGAQFRRSEVEALLDDTVDSVSFSNYLQGLLQANLFVSSETGVDARYTFVQPLFREILYTSLPFERRRELHTRLAEHLKSLPGRRRQLRNKIAAFLDDTQPQNPLEDLDRLAYHYEMSGQWLLAAQQVQEAAFTLENANPEKETRLTRMIALLERYNTDAPASSPASGPGLEISAPKIRAHLALADIAFQRNDLAASAAATETAVGVTSLETLPPELALKLASRVAFYLPAQGKLPQAEKIFSRLANKQPGWQWQALQNWLSAHSAGARQTTAPSEELSSETTRMSALRLGMAGSWAEAEQCARRLRDHDFATLMQVRLGDALANQGQLQEAEAAYLAASQTWFQAEAWCGIALTRYRAAELDWRANHITRSALALLEESLAALEKAPLALQTLPRAVIQKALARMKNRREGPWEAWQWQPFEDILYINLALPIFDELENSNVHS